MLLNALEQFSFKVSSINSVFITFIVYIFLLFSIFSNNSFKGFKVILKTSISWFFYQKIFKLFINIKFDRFCLLLTSLFIFILALNLFGTFTYAFSFTGIFYLTTLMATGLIFWTTLIAITRFNINFFSLLAPIGTPGFLAKSLVAIETISYLGRFVSLNVRLFINIISGHLILKLLYSSLLIVLVSINFSPTFFLSLLCFGGLTFFIFGLELFVATLQAYIFFFLLFIYLKVCLW